MPILPGSRSPTANLILAIIVLNALGTLVLFTETDLDARQMSREIGIVQQPIRISETRSALKKTGSGMMQPLADGVEEPEQLTYDTWDFNFKYPKDFFVAMYPDEFVGEQQDARITSKPGSLFLPGGVGGLPAPGEFASGYQMTIRQMAAGQNPVGDARLVKTDNPNVDKIDFVCDGARCPLFQYLITIYGKQYLIEVRASDDYKNVDRVTSGIISTIGK